MNLALAQAKVTAFQRAFGLTVGETPAVREPALRADLIREECGETRVALLDRDLVEIADGLADVLYVTLGAAVACGVDAGRFKLRSPLLVLAPPSASDRDPTQLVECLQTVEDVAVTALFSDDLQLLEVALTSVIQVCLIVAAMYGIEIEPIFDEVHRSNLAKLGGTKDLHGKLQKPAGWTPPDIAAELRKQGWAP